MRRHLILVLILAFLGCGKNSSNNSTSNGPNSTDDADGKVDAPAKFNNKKDNAGKPVKPGKEIYAHGCAGQTAQPDYGYDLRLQRNDFLKYRYRFASSAGKSTMTYAEHIGAIAPLDIVKDTQIVELKGVGYDGALPIEIVNHCQLIKKESGRFEESCDSKVSQKLPGGKKMGVPMTCSGKNSQFKIRESSTGSFTLPDGSAVTAVHYIMAGTVDDIVCKTIDGVETRFGPGTQTFEWVVSNDVLGTSSTHCGGSTVFMRVAMAANKNPSAPVYAVRYEVLQAPKPKLDPKN